MMRGAGRGGGALETLRALTGGRIEPCFSGRDAEEVRALLGSLRAHHKQEIVVVPNNDMTVDFWYLANAEKVDVKGYDVDVKGYEVAVKGYEVDVR
eukprot:4575161-Pyramimonas_sp.AAC.2